MSKKDKRSTRVERGDLIAVAYLFGNRPKLRTGIVAEVTHFGDVRYFSGGNIYICKTNEYLIIG